jgi:hypothetical protein
MVVVAMAAVVVMMALLVRVRCPDITTDTGFSWRVGGFGGCPSWRKGKWKKKKKSMEERRGHRVGEDVSFFSFFFFFFSFFISSSFPSSDGHVGNLWDVRKWVGTTCKIACL